MIDWLIFTIPPFSLPWHLPLWRDFPFLRSLQPQLDYQISYISYWCYEVLQFILLYHDAVAILNTNTVPAQPHVLTSRVHKHRKTSVYMKRGCDGPLCRGFNMFALLVWHSFQMHTVTLSHVHQRNAYVYEQKHTYKLSGRAKWDHISWGSHLLALAVKWHNRQVRTELIIAWYIVTNVTWAEKFSLVKCVKRPEWIIQWQQSGPLTQWLSYIFVG